MATPGFPPPPTDGYWLYEGGHHWAIMRGAETFWRTKALSPSVSPAGSVAGLRKELGALVDALNRLSEE